MARCRSGPGGLPKAVSQRLRPRDRQVRGGGSRDFEGRLGLLYERQELHRSVVGFAVLIAQTHRGYSENVLQYFMQELLELLPEEVLQGQVDAP